MTTEAGFMDIEGTYAELESVDVGLGQVSRRVMLSRTVNLVLTVDTESRMRGVRFEFEHQSSLVSQVDQVRGLKFSLVSSTPKAQQLRIDQVRPGDSVLFGVVVQDLVRAVTPSTGEEAKKVSERLSRWKAFFSRNVEGLTREEQLGLFAELVVLQELQAAGVPVDRSVALWEGPHSEVHDFSAQDWALEVKASASLASASATINSERQLDPGEISPLFLIFLGYDVRPHSQGLTLPQIVGRVRKSLANFANEADHFEDLLIDVGYLDIHASLYFSHYESTREEVFAVRQDFPSLRTTDLPPAVSRTKYQLNIDQCQEWRVTFEAMVEPVLEQYR
ncbi:hypothetical protein GCM10007382_07740 [Salinibacterium xinjiangense]|uniref:PD-(D/E)XK family member n=1 Tax=Salinibacterium xinjiangense TaxID=386302 RepID=A0A2C8ZB63_9MICO|nr:PD-(D/E)XK motif protein [Salinibacterium xinjiangense]GGK90145.1 hypothetical protein GCM10007382_07740 [Salinibacterium xinjiangense]SOE61384.1 Putative PD-(D/E)XK family member [Salinibacterium xinjiangense]